MLCGGIACLALASSAVAQIPFERPGPRDFILDQAHLITEADQQQIRQIADRLLTDKAAPIIVVTITSLAENGGAGMSIETYARQLFNQWGIGPAEVRGQPWNHGMLLLVSKGDRKARIELGAGWGRHKDAEADLVMRTMIIPPFKQGEFSRGILTGVIGLDQIARSLQLPSSMASQSDYRIQYCLLGLLISLASFSIVSIVREGHRGWAWIFWGAVFAAVGAVLYSMLNSDSDSGSSGGGFGGDSFGGGFSDGGGSTGSW
jgi:uncharacterized protein